MEQPEIEKIIKDYLTENLKVEVNTNYKYNTIEVRIMLNKKEISKSEDTITYLTTK